MVRSCSNFFSCGTKIIVFFAGNGTRHARQIGIRHNSKWKHTLGAGMAPHKGTTVAWCSFYLLCEISLGTESVSQQELTHHLGHVGTHGHELSIDAPLCRGAIAVKMLRPGHVFLAVLVVHSHLLRNAVAIDPTNSWVLQQLPHAVNACKVFFVLWHAHVASIPTT